MTLKKLCQILVEQHFNSFKYTFFDHTVNEWDSLSNHMRESNSIVAFKGNVLSCMKNY